MTDREKLEQVAKWEKSDPKVPCFGWDCYECFMKKECYDTGANTGEKVRDLARRLLAEMDKEWKPLEVDNLPPDILTGDYEFECWKRWQEWQSSDSSPSLILSQMSNRGVKYRYRPRKHEPTVEELAEEWFGHKRVYIPMCLSYSDSLKTIKQLKDAYMAGYKKASS